MTMAPTLNTGDAGMESGRSVTTINNFGSSLAANCPKLTTTNYVIWSRSIRICIRQRGLDKFIKEPTTATTTVPMTYNGSIIEFFSPPNLGEVRSLKVCKPLAVLPQGGDLVFKHTAVHNSL